MKVYPERFIEVTEQTIIELMEGLADIADTHPEMYEKNIKDVGNAFRDKLEIDSILGLSLVEKQGEKMLLIFIFEQIKSEEGKVYNLVMDKERNIPYIELPELEASA